MKKNRKISVYWQDVKVYNQDDNKTLSKMLTEGILIKKTKDYIYLKNPETLSLDRVKNHPTKQPRLYYIPKSLITEIIYD